MKNLSTLIRLILIVTLCTLVLCSCGDSEEPGTSPTPTQAANAGTNKDATPTAGPATGTVTPAGKDRFPDRPNADTRTGQRKELAAGDVAPEFSLTLEDGSIFRMSEHDDGVVLLNFWATWCGPCVREMPDLQKLFRESVPGVTVCCISVGDDSQTVKEFINETGYDKAMIGCADSTHISEYYPSDYIPYTVIVVNGIVKDTIIGSNSYDFYKQKINGYLAEN